MRETGGRFCVETTLCRGERQSHAHAVVVQNSRTVDSVTNTPVTSGGATTASAARLAAVARAALDLAPRQGCMASRALGRGPPGKPPLVFSRPPRGLTPVPFIVIRDELG